MVKFGRSPRSGCTKPLNVQQKPACDICVACDESGFEARIAQVSEAMGEEKEDYRRRCWTVAVDWRKGAECLGIVVAESWRGRGWRIVVGGLTGLGPCLD